MKKLIGEDKKVLFFFANKRYKKIIWKIFTNIYSVKNIRKKDPLKKCFENYNKNS